MNGPEQFKDFAAQFGYELPQSITPGKMFRFSTNNKHSDDSGWAILFSDERGGVVGDWRNGTKHVWQEKRDQPLTRDELQSLRARAEKAQREARIQRENDANQAASRAQSIWNDSQPAPANHGYLTKKGVRAHSLKVYDGQEMTLRGMSCRGALILPLRNAEGEIRSLEFISADGEKRFLPGADYSGCYFAIGQPGKKIALAEGYSTGASIHEATGLPVRIAATAGNLLPVARALKSKAPEIEVLPCADNDVATICQPHQLEGLTEAVHPLSPRPDWCRCNPGMTAAIEVARDLRGAFASPSEPGDFNDLHTKRGTEAVKAAIEGALPPVPKEQEQPKDTAMNAVALRTAASEAPVAGWPDVLPLTVDHARTAYPLDALPDPIRAAVVEVVSFVQCPESLAACSALSALSVAGQALVDVERAGTLSGPTSLYLLAIAESGERKTSCDRYFTEALREWEKAEREARQPLMAEKRAQFAAWEAKKESTLTTIKAAMKARSTPDLEVAERELVDLEKKRPSPERWPQLLYTDTTPESLAWDLSRADGWPSGGMIASEAGIVLGSHGMRRDSIMANLALLNSLWDGASHNVNRRTSDSFSVRGVRLTMGLATQTEVLRDFLESSKIARGIGFVARFLVTWPESTIGFRKHKEAESWQHLSSFKERLSNLLKIPHVADEAGSLSPVVLKLSPAAKAAWVAFYEDIEAELKPGKEMSEMKDIASKAADNAARLAALFHLYRHGPEGVIGEEDITSAARIVGWHLYEARRFLGDIALPRTTTDAMRLSEWLGRFCRGEVPASEGKKAASIVQRKAQAWGPVRDGDRFLKALNELDDAGHIRRMQEGGKKLIQVNPALRGE